MIRLHFHTPPLPLLLNHNRVTLLLHLISSGALAQKVQRDPRILSPPMDLQLLRWCGSRATLIKVSFKLRLRAIVWPPSTHKNHATRLWIHSAQANPRPKVRKRPLLRSRDPKILHITTTVRLHLPGVSPLLMAIIISRPTIIFLPHNRLARHTTKLLTIIDIWLRHAGTKLRVDSWLVPYQANLIAIRSSDIWMYTMWRRPSMRYELFKFPFFLPVSFFLFLSQ